VFLTIVNIKVKKKIYLWPRNWATGFSYKEKIAKLKFKKFAAKEFRLPYHVIIM
jgi:hypothetical protein